VTFNITFRCYHLENHFGNLLNRIEESIKRTYTKNIQFKNSYYKYRNHQYIEGLMVILVIIRISKTRIICPINGYLYW